MAKQPKRPKPKPSGDPVEKIGRHLDKTDDHTLLILRAHLLIEERMRDIVARVCTEPTKLEPARLSFYQVLCLCRALVGSHLEIAFAFVERLNTVRNKMAHHLEPGDLDELVGSVTERVGRIHKKDKTPLKRFRRATYYVCGCLDSLRGSIRLGHAFNPGANIHK